MGNDPEPVQIMFTLEPEDDDWPPADSETLWATPLGNDRYRLENIPFFVPLVALGDVVVATPDAGVLTFHRVVEEGGHSTIHVVTQTDDSAARLVAELESLGCAVGSDDNFTTTPFLAVDIPRAADVAAVLGVLDSVRAAGQAFYQEDSISDHHSAAHDAVHPNHATQEDSDPRAV